MSYMGVDPGDLRPDEMYGDSQADGLAPLKGTLVRAMPCYGCHGDDQQLDTEIMSEEGSCVFGCGRRVDRDTRMCAHCNDHSANEWECPVCGTNYSDWSGQWEQHDAA